MILLWSLLILQNDLLQKVNLWHNHDTVGIPWVDKDCHQEFLEHLYYNMCCQWFDPPPIMQDLDTTKTDKFCSENMEYKLVLCKSVKNTKNQENWIICLIDLVYLTLITNHYWDAFGLTIGLKIISSLLLNKYNSVSSFGTWHDQLAFVVLRPMWHKWVSLSFFKWSVNGWDHLRWTEKSRTNSCQEVQGKLKN